MNPYWKYAAIYDLGYTGVVYSYRSELYGVDTHCQNKEPLQLTGL
jgi:hypothetical protein